MSGSINKFKLKDKLFIVFWKNNIFYMKPQKLSNLF
jgi:hypothetical protein